MKRITITLVAIAANINAQAPPTIAITKTLTVTTTRTETVVYATDIDSVPCMTSSVAATSGASVSASDSISGVTLTATTESLIEQSSSAGEQSPSGAITTAPSNTPPGGSGALCFASSPTGATSGYTSCTTVAIPSSDASSVTSTSRAPSGQTPIQSSAGAFTTNGTNNAAGQLRNDMAFVGFGGLVVLFAVS